MQADVDKMVAAAANKTPYELLALLYTQYAPLHASLTLEALSQLPADKPSAWRKPLLLALKDYHPDRNDASLPRDTLKLDPLEWSALCLAATQLLGEKSTRLRDVQHTFDD